MTEWKIKKKKNKAIKAQGQVWCTDTSLPWDKHWALTFYLSPATGWWISWRAHWCDRRTLRQTRSLWLKCCPACPVWSPPGKVRHRSAWNKMLKGDQPVHRPGGRRLLHNLQYNLQHNYVTFCIALAGCRWWPRCSTCRLQGPVARSSRSLVLIRQKSHQVLQVKKIRRHFSTHQILYGKLDHTL